MPISIRFLLSFVHFPITFYSFYIRFFCLLFTMFSASLFIVAFSYTLPKFVIYIVIFTRAQKPPAICAAAFSLSWLLSVLYYDNRFTRTFTIPSIPSSHFFLCSPYQNSNQYCPKQQASNYRCSICCLFCLVYHRFFPPYS